MNSAAMPPPRTQQERQPLRRAGCAAWSAAQSGIDALPMHLPVRLGNAGMTQTKAAPVRVLGFDQALVWVTVALLAWGLVMVYSASIALPDNPRFARQGYGPAYFLTRHAASVGDRLHRRAAGLPGADARPGSARRPGSSSPRCCCWWRC